MNRRRGHSINALLVVAACGIVYTGLLRFNSLTGIEQVDGVVGVLLGLYVCSYPAAYLVDSLFFRRGGQDPFLARHSFLWFALNMLVLIIGSVVIFLGTTRLIARGD